MKRTHSTATGSLALAMAIVLTAGEAEAADEARSFEANPASYCQAALPVFDGNIRKRPLALKNEGQSSAFVTCSFTGQDDPLLLVRMRVSAPVALDVSCTGVTGAEGDDNQFVTKTFHSSFAVTAGELVWNGVDFGGGDFSFIPGDGLFSVSCNLPPGATLRDSDILFIEDVGD